MSLVIIVLSFVWLERNTTVLPERDGEKKDNLSLFNPVPLDINAFGPMILKKRDPIAKEIGILLLQKLFHSTMFHHCFQNGDHAEGKSKL